MLTYKNLEEAINDNQSNLDEGEKLTFLFDDGIATIVEDGNQVKTYLEEVPCRIVGSISQFKLD